MHTPDAANSPQPPRSRHWARRTHRLIGVSALLFLVLISASGLILNHADSLGLPRIAAGPWLRSLYGVELPPVDSAFAAGGVWFATAADTLYANGEPFAQSAQRLIGAVSVDNAIVVATGNEFFVATADATLIERFAPEITQPMRALGTEGRHIIVALADGHAQFDADLMTLDVAENIALNTVTWSQPTTPSAQQLQQVGAAALGQAINWERVLLDLHSGRILPGLGRYLADITAIALLYMCFSGIVLWTRRR